MTPFLAGTVFSSPGLFIGNQLTKASNWVATGAEIDFCGCQFRILPCLDWDYKRTDALSLLSKVQALKKDLTNMSPEKFSILYSQLHPDRSADLAAAASGNEAAPLLLPQQ
jgi:hypothetical protein